MKIYVILVLLFLYNTNKSFGSIKTTDSISAIINHHIILDSDVKKNLNIEQYSTSNIYKNLSKTTLPYQETLNQLIIKNLIFDAANRENIFAENDQIDHIINNTLHSHNMNLDQFQTYLCQFKLNLKKYYTEMQQNITNNMMCNHIVHQRIQISQDEINNTIQILNTIDYNKEFKIIHIIIPLPIHATQNQIKIAENLATSLIHTNKINNNILKIINTYNTTHHIFQKIETQKTKWISWKNIPIIFDPYLQIININDIIGPIRSHDGIHILKIIDIRNKMFIFPITKVKINTIVSKNSYKKNDVIKNLLKIKKCVENNDTTFNIIAKEKSQNYYVIPYKKCSQWNDIENFEPEIKKILKNLKKNEISIPIYTSLGWCLIQLIDINNLNYSTMIRERAYHYLLHQKFETIINNWIQELRLMSYIKIIK